MIANLDDLEDECQYNKQEIRSQLTLHTGRYEVLVQRTNMDQADSVSQLTWLAAVFLPLSLAAAILSMQTRFIDLDLLLYDFVGMVVLLGALAILLNIFSRYGIPLYNWLLRRVYWGNDFPEVHKAIKAFWVFVWMSVLLASFLVGMLKDVKLGVETLGYGVGGTCALWFASISVVRHSMARSLES